MIDTKSKENVIEKAIKKALKHYSKEIDELNLDRYALTNFSRRAIMEFIWACNTIENFKKGGV